MNGKTENVPEEYIIAHVQGRGDTHSAGKLDNRDQLPPPELWVKFQDWK